jgi:hypothetical protein
MTRIDEKLNLVVSIERDGGSVYIHATPITREAFEAHFRLLAATHADLFGRGGAYAQVAPRVATLTLRDVGQREARQRGDDGGDGGSGTLLAEIKRLAMVAVPTPEGWQLLPVDAAVQRGSLDADDWREAESAIVFFTSVWWLTPRRDAANAAKILAQAIGLSTTSSSPSEWIASLPSLTPAATSAPTHRKASSIPS